MTRPRTLASAVVLFHLVSITTVALIREPTDAQPSDGAEARGLDHIARGIQVTNDVLWRRTSGLRLLTTPYVRTLGLHQRWDMFSMSSQSEAYVRVSFEIGLTGETPGGGQRIVHQLVSPASGADRLKGLQAFPDSYRDKTLEGIVRTFAARKGPDLLNTIAQRRRAALGESDNLQRALDAASQDFPPLIRYYRRQYGRQHLRPNESIARAEIWYGIAPIAPPAETSALDRQARNTALARQFDDAVRAFRTEQPPLGAQERQAGIVWTLYYVEMP